jgi:hypothetical protein
MNDNKYQLDDEFSSLKVYDYDAKNKQMGKNNPEKLST